MFKRIYQTAFVSQPTTLVGDKENMSLRFVKYFFLWLMLWQDSSVTGSIFQYQELFGSMKPFRPFEIILLLNFLVLIIERTITRDYTVKRSYFWGPLILLGLAFFLSWMRGMVIRQEVAVVFEVHEAFLLPFEFFIFRNLLREPGEWRIIPILLILATIAKASDGVYIYFFSADEGKGWGVLQNWRDGYLLGMGVISLVHFLHYKGKTLQWLKKTLIICSPLIFFSLITSYRRTFFVAILVSLIIMFVSIGKGNRKKHAFLFVSLLLTLFVFILVTDPIGFITRMFAVVNPKEEGSAYIRLMELPNVLMNIYDNPIFGTAIGTQWHQYFRMPLFANFTTLGTHNSYLYWPLRGGIFALIGFWWMISRIWKVVLLQNRFTENVDDKFLAQISMYMIIMYMLGSFFGLMYGDIVTPIMAMYLTSLQLFTEERFGMTKINNIKLWQTLKEKKVILRFPSASV